MTCGIVEQIGWTCNATLILDIEVDLGSVIAGDADQSMDAVGFGGRAGGDWSYYLCLQSLIGGDICIIGHNDIGSIEIGEHGFHGYAIESG